MRRPSGENRVRDGRTVRWSVDAGWSRPPGRSRCCSCRRDTTGRPASGRPVTRPAGRRRTGRRSGVSRHRRRPASATARRAGRWPACGRPARVVPPGRCPAGRTAGARPAPGPARPSGSVRTTPPCQPRRTETAPVHRRHANLPTIAPVRCTQHPSRVKQLGCPSARQALIATSSTPDSPVGDGRDEQDCPMWMLRRVDRTRSERSVDE
jgi:hypothetical protein